MSNLPVDREPTRKNPTDVRALFLGPKAEN